jgi:hypothetical protein
MYTTPMLLITALLVNGLHEMQVYGVKEKQNYGLNHISVTRIKAFPLQTKSSIEITYQHGKK